MPSQRQPDEIFVDLKFPIKGLDVSQGYGMQQPGTTPIGQNVRAYDALMRARGGTRPGLAKYISVQIAGASLIQELNSVIGSGYVAPGS